MKVITSFDPTAAVGGEFDAQVVNPCGRLVLYNESSVGILLIFPSGDTGILPPYFYKSYWIAKPGIVKWQRIFTLYSAGSTNHSVQGVSYESAELKNHTFGEGPLNRQTNIGNSVPIGSSVDSVVNDGNPANTTVVEATQSGSSGSNVVITNSGTVTIAEFISSIYTKLLQIIPGDIAPVRLGASGRNTQVLGDFTIFGDGYTGRLFIYDHVTFPDTDGYITGEFGLKLGINSTLGNILDAQASGNTYLKAQNNIIAQTPNGTDIASFNSSGINLLAGKLNLLTGAISRVSKFTAAVTTTPTAFAHGLGDTPDIILLQPTGAVSTVRTVMYSDPPGAVNVTLTGNASFNVVGLAIKF